MDAHTGPLEADMLADASDGRLDRHTLLSAALIASGVGDRATLERQEAAFRSALRRLHHHLADSHCLREKARSVFQFMHEELLFGGYALQTTDLRETFRSGKYNCLTATIIFNCLANEVGLPTCAVRSPGHALSRVFLPDGSLDVETTCPRWFQLSGRPAEQAEHVRQTLGTTPASRSGAQEASEVELVAMIYYNRGVDLLAAERFAEAAAANLKSLRLYPNSPTARGNLLATINNWAIELARQRQFAEAAHLLRLGMALEPSFQTFMVNYVFLHQQWTAQLCQQGMADQALRLLRQQAAAFPQETFFARAAAELQSRQRSTATHTQPDRAEVFQSPAPAALTIPNSGSPSAPTQ
jgi:tetratricopeptide (TPR) repeat protein